MKHSTHRNFKTSEMFEGDDDDDDYVEVVDDDIYFYSIVTTKSVLQLNKELAKLNKKMGRRKTPGQEIRIFVHSEGGSVDAGMSAMDHIGLSNIPVHVIVDGFAGSASTFFILKAAKKSILPHGRILIHQISGGIVGNYGEMKAEFNNCSMIQNNVREMYRTYCKIPKKVMDEIMHHDIEICASDCVRYGIVDEIVTSL